MRRSRTGGPVKSAKNLNNVEEVFNNKEGEQRMKEKRLRSETVQKTREETEVRKANERIATTRALTVVQQEHDVQKGPSGRT